MFNHPFKMKKIITISLLLLGMTCGAHAQKRKIASKVEKIDITYQDQRVKARQLTVVSEIPMHIDSAWANVKTPALLQFVAKGMLKFKAVDGELPKQWQLGETYGVKMRVFGFIPFGGTHYLYIEQVNDSLHRIATKEWDKSAKVWNHTIVMKNLGNGNIYYEDSITIYAGALTSTITAFARRFYIHRQKRWQIVARENLVF